MDMVEKAENLEDTSTSIDRRSVLKGIGVAGLAGVGASPATADETHSTGGDNSFDPLEATAADVRAAIMSERATARSIVQQYLERINVYDEALNSLITVNPDALERADELDAKFKALLKSSRVDIEESDSSHRVHPLQLETSFSEHRQT